MFASSKALTQQKRSIALAGFCGGFLRGPVAMEVTGTTVVVAPYPTDLRNRILGLNSGQPGSVGCTPTCA